MSDIDMAYLRQWIGRGEDQVALIDAGQAARVAATLDHDNAPAIGQALPPLWHWCYFTPVAPQSELGSDGHPKRGGFMPPIPLPRRMWAGGHLRFLKPITVGQTVTRVTHIVDIVEKSGTQGPLLFVTLRHTLSTDSGVAVEEVQDLVYRSESKSAPGVPAPKASERLPAQWRDPICFDPALLFRYSALTFNAHRIHYDLPYAQQEEGYPGLVVQGPLAATCLVERLLANSGRRLVAFSFRGKQPLIAGQHPAHMCGKAEEQDGHFSLWAESADGHVTMSATAITEASDGD